jgi:hypothetical protein
VIPEISGNPALKNRLDRAWQKAEREWRRQYSEKTCCHYSVLAKSGGTLFRELPGVECPLTKDAVVDFEEWV